MDRENMDNLNNLITEIDQQRREVLIKKMFRKRFLKTAIIILALTTLIFIPIEAAYMQEPEFVLLDSQHNIDRNGNCVVHAIVRHANFDRQIVSAATGMTARHQVKFNDLRKYRTIIYMYRNMFDYVGGKPFKTVHMYSDSKFVHIPKDD
ncbi:hypothetical protein [Robinsoniella peoriensis]|uniref:hypothetical protein n=1 Tax=Robinsoniella peoriensis TaxID=180332 RepID=UPI00374FF53F